MLLRKSLDTLFVCDKIHTSTNEREFKMIFRKNTNQEQKNLDTMNSLYEFKNIINKMNDILESEEFEKLKEKILLLKNDNNCRTLDDALCFVDDTESYIFNILENIDCAIIRMTTKD